MGHLHVPGGHRPGPLHLVLEPPVRSWQQGEELQHLLLHLLRADDLCHYIGFQDHLQVRPHRRAAAGGPAAGPVCGPQQASGGGIDEPAGRPAEFAVSGRG